MLVCRQRPLIFGRVTAACAMSLFTSHAASGRGQGGCLDLLIVLLLLFESPQWGCNVCVIFWLIAGL